MLACMGASEWTIGWTSRTGFNWLRERRNEWAGRRVNEWISEWVKEWTNKWLNKWSSEWMGGWVSACMRAWLREWVSEWVNEWVRAWITHWVDGLRKKWMNGWTSECNLHFQGARGHNKPCIDFTFFSLQWKKERKKEKKKIRKKERNKERKEERKKYSLLINSSNEMCPRHILASLNAGKKFEAVPNSSRAAARGTLSGNQYMGSKKFHWFFPMMKVLGQCGV